MTREEILMDFRALKKAYEGDQISSHIEADNLLCALLISLDCKEVVKEYRTITKGYNMFSTYGTLRG